MWFRPRTPRCWPFQVLGADPAKCASLLEQSRETLCVSRSRPPAPLLFGIVLQEDAMAQPALQRVIPTIAERTPSVEEAFRTYAPYVAAVARRLIGRDQELEDIVQDVFLASVRALPQLAHPEAIKGMLATITVRVSTRQLRRRRAWAMLGLDDIPDYLEVAAPAIDPERRALLARVYALLDKLPATTRVAWALRHIQGERLEDVARLCGCSLATAKRRISQAHLFIEGALQNE
jgi:RNA polymerase sigma-70 factor (ECF subfamily)